jgi:hypothetical protein
MNMISTGAFQTEMDASNKQPTLAEKFAAVWEKKNARAARAGGVSLMALSLAACGSDDATTTATTATTTTTTTTTTVTTPSGDSMQLTSGTDTVTSSSGSLNGSAATVRFANGSNETVTATNSTMQTTDNLIDGDTTDNDVLNVTISGAMNAMTATNIETVNVTTAAGSAQAVTLSNFSGLKTVNVSGAQDLTVDDAGSASVVFTDYTQDGTINNDTLASLTNVQTVEVSGGSWGSLDTGQTNIVLTADGTAGVLETLNVISSGAAANNFGLDAGTGVTLKSVAVTGSAAATIRVAHADVTAKTIDATAATGDVTLRVDMNSTSAALNALNMTGIDNFLMVDSTVTSDAASISNMTSGQLVTIGDDMDATTFTVASATVASPASLLKITLDNETADVDLDVSNINAQNVESLELASNGYSGSALATAENSTGTLDGDFTTILISGDTSLDTVLDIDGAGTLETTARTVSVNASTNTAFVTIDAVDDTYVSYELTGSAGNDTLKLNETAGVVVGGAGKDTIHSSGKADTIDGGEGNDTIYASNGTDAVTLGAGSDTIYFGEVDVAATPKVMTAGDMSNALTLAAANDDVIVTVNGFSYNMDVATDSDQGHDVANDLVTLHAATILADTGVTIARAGTATSDTAGLTFTGASDGTEFTAGVTISDNGVGSIVAVNVTTAAASGSSVNTVISDFDAGTATAGGDVLGFDVSEINALIVDLSDSGGDVVDSATDGNVMHTYTVGTAQATGDVNNGANVIYIKQSDTINSFADVSTALAANSIELDNALATSDGIAGVYYDTDDAKTVFGLFVEGGGGDATMDGDITFSAMGEMAMTKAEYALLDATNFSFIA